MLHFRFRCDTYIFPPNRVGLRRAHLFYLDRALPVGMISVLSLRGTLRENNLPSCRDLAPSGMDIKSWRLFYQGTLNFKRFHLRDPLKIAFASRTSEFSSGKAEGSNGPESMLFIIEDPF